MKKSQERCLSRRAVIAGLLLTGAGAAHAATSYYDKNGFYQGKKSDDGSFNDRNGFYQGKQTEDGSYYDKNGFYQGSGKNRP